MRYVLHIGTNKTGTSTLQHYLGTHRKELQAEGIWYPELGSFPFAHHDLAQGIKENDIARFAIDPKTLTEPAVPQGTKTVLISSENFHTLRDVVPVGAIFPPDRTIVVLYLREHVSYLASWYQQAVQARDLTLSLFDFCVTMGYPLFELVERWRQVYGKNLKVRAYERDKLVDSDIVADFFSTAFGTQVPVVRQFKDKNPSISGNLLFLKLMLNHLLTPEENREIVEELSALANIDKRFSGKLLVSERDAKRIARRYAQDRKQLKQELGIVLQPPREGLQGNAAPDLATLRDDVALLLGAAKSRKFDFYDIFLKKRDLMFPPV